MPILKYTGNARIFRTATPDDADETTPRMVTVERDDSREVDVDEATADKLLNLGVFEVVDDSDDDGEPERPNAEDFDNFAELSGVGSATEGELYDAGYETFGDLRKASDEDLLAIDGIGDSALGSIRSDLADRDDDSASDTDETPTDGDFDVGG